MRIDAARSEALRGALSQWVIYGREAELEARAEQRAVSIDLLQAARQTALGTSAARSLMDQHREQLLVVRAAQAATGETLQRLERRIAGVQQLVDAGVKTADTIEARLRTEPGNREHLLELRAHAVALVEQSSELLGELESARVAAIAGAAAAARAAERHEAVERAVGVVQQNLTSASRTAAGALALMTEAGQRLESLAPLYEAAQLSSIDLRRDLPPPSGTPLPAPSSATAPRPITRFSTEAVA